MTCKDCIHFAVYYRYKRGIRDEDLIVLRRLTEKEVHEIWKGGNFVWTK